MDSPAGRPLERRGAAALVLGLFVAGGIVFVFAGTLTRATELEAQATRLAAQVAFVDQQYKDGQAELRFIDDDRFVEQQARANGYGTREEKPFRLPADAPSPPPIVPLGENGPPTTPLRPFEAWLQLLFG
jgi:hypothetical protein